jgi:cob(I)alamin adenosyltransferase
MPSIATRTGDGGTTSLLYGQRVAKNHPQIEAVGTFDELNAALGLAKATCPASAAAVRDELGRIQLVLTALMGELACAEADTARYAASKFPQLTDADLAAVDAAVAAIEARQPKFDGWATPGANVHAATLEVARTIARRAERRLLDLPAQGRTVRPLVLHFTNRLADLLWLMAREAEQP